MFAVEDETQEQAQYHMTPRCLAPIFFTSAHARQPRSNEPDRKVDVTAKTLVRCGFVDHLLACGDFHSIR